MRKPSWELILPEAAQVAAKYTAKDWEMFRLFFRANERAFEHYVDKNMSAVLPDGTKQALTDDQKYALSAKLMHDFVYGSFKRLGGRVYKIAAEFGAELNRTKLDLPVKHSPRAPEAICIEFPDGVVFDVPSDEGPRQVSSVFLFSLDGEDAEPGLVVSYHLFIPMLMPGTTLITHCQHYWESLGSLATTIDESFAKGEDESTARPRAKQDEVAFQAMTHRILVYALKCLLYINSGQPDLRAYRPPPPPLTQNPKKLRRWEKENADTAMIPMTFVGYDWKKPRVFGVESTVVTGHFRWQPYGPGRAQVKLIWIDQHERHYETTNEAL